MSDYSFTFHDSELAKSLLSIAAICAENGSDSCDLSFNSFKCHIKFLAVEEEIKNIDWNKQKKVKKEGRFFQKVFKRLKVIQNT